MHNQNDGDGAPHNTIHLAFANELVDGSSDAAVVRNCAFLEICPKCTIDRLRRPGRHVLGGSIQFGATIEFHGNLIPQQPALHPADGQQIPEALEEAVPDAVLALAVETGVVGHGDLGDGVAFHLQQSRDEAVQAAI